VDAAAWYEQQRAGLAHAFLLAVQDAIAAILVAPQRWPKGGSRVRRYRMNRFPYSIIYVSESDGILILAVAHHSRRPGYWRNRI
jgi:hypothetical protein